ncbi:CLUMA_CG014492, isoform A, partial [Clunio marinus]
NFIVAIPCDFKFVEIDPQYPKDLDRIDLNDISEQQKFVGPGNIFQCDEKIENLENVGGSSIPSASSNQNQPDLFTLPDEDYFEDIESTCQVSRRTIQPKALNNIYNKLTKVVNTASFIQSIHIEQCVTKNEPCNSGSNAPTGTTYICRQKHVRITLKAIKEDDGNMIVDEQFYYPSHCVCELVTIKPKKKKELQSSIMKCMQINPFK